MMRKAFFYYGFVSFKFESNIRCYLRVKLDEKNENLDVNSNFDFFSPNSLRKFFQNF